MRGNAVLRDLRDLRGKMLLKWPSTRCGSATLPVTAPAMGSEPCPFGTNPCRPIREAARKIDSEPGHRRELRIVDVPRLVRHGMIVGMRTGG